jgi:phosphotransferase system HPr-like phosphotransfer protein
VLSLGIEKGMDITLIADGEDEAAALDGLASLIETGFNE